jgi:hypothetical protein
MSYWFCSQAVYKPVWHIPLLSVQWINSWWWTEELFETCRVACQNNFVKLVYLVGFIIKKLHTVYRNLILESPTHLRRHVPRRLELNLTEVQNVAQKDLHLYNSPRTGCLSRRIYTGAESISEGRRKEKRNTVYEPNQYAYILYIFRF